MIRHRKFYWFSTFCTISIDEKSSGCRRQDCKNGYSSDKHTFGTFFNIKKTKQTIKVGSSKIHLWQCVSWKLLGFGYHWHGHEWYSRLHSLQGVLLKLYKYFTFEKSKFLFSITTILIYNGYFLKVVFSKPSWKAYCCTKSLFFELET